MKVNISASKVTSATRALVNPVLERLASDIRKDAGQLARAQLGRYDRTRRPPIGQYRNGWKVPSGVTYSRGGTVITKQVVNEARHAEWIEFGTRPHMIVPRNGGYLRFQGSRGTVYARRVRHPGTRAYRIGQQAIQRARLR